MFIAHYTSVSPNAQNPRLIIYIFVHLLFHMYTPPMSHTDFSLPPKHLNHLLDFHFLIPAIAALVQVLPCPSKM